MSALENAKRFWKDFSKREPEIKKALINEDYEKCQELILDLDEYAYAHFGCHFFVDNAYSDFEMTWDTGPNKTTQYLASMVCETAPVSIQKSWILQPFLPPLSQKAIQAQVQIKDEIYSLTDFLLFYEPQEAQNTWKCWIYCPGFSLIPNAENKREMSIYLLEMALGQCAYEAYVGEVDSLDAPDPNRAFCNLVDAYETFMDQVEKKGWKTYSSPLDIYSVYQPIKEIADDSFRKDMKFLFTTHPLFTEDTIEGNSDVLKDLEAKEGEFGTIYYGNLFGSREDALFRQQLSMQLGKAFIPYAKVIAGSIGKSFSYIDVIVFDREQFNLGLQKIQKKLDKQVKLYYQKF
ncbi:MAG TPA: hypothetical protein H9886_04890 [Candidatus Faecalicoccus intestinipullorum]|nr:hypothetical protein [Candidatus Faecalicoccus intestinipullorum]